MIFIFDQIEELKRQYTDRYVVVDDSRPELARFRGATGLVKTVNMSGRALVEFQDYLANIGWYDIELDFLKIVPKPEPTAALAGHGAKPAVAKAPLPAKPAAAAKPAAKPAAAAPAAAKAGGKMSVAEIMAAARAKAAPGQAAGPPGRKPAKEAAPEPIAAGPVAAEPAEEISRPSEETATLAVEVPAAAPIQAKDTARRPAKKVAAAGPKPTTTAEKIAYCRRVDAKS